MDNPKPTTPEPAVKDAQDDRQKKKREAQAKKVARQLKLNGS